MPDTPYLVDTSAWLFALRKDYLPELEDRIDFLLTEDFVTTTGIVRVPLLSGTKAKKEFQRLKTRLDLLDSLPTENDVSHKACQLSLKIRGAKDYLIVTCLRDLVC